MNIVDSLIIRQNIQYFSWKNTCEIRYKWRNNFDFDIELKNSIKLLNLKFKILIIFQV